MGSFLIKLRRLGKSSLSSMLLIPCINVSPNLGGSICLALRTGYSPASISWVDELYGPQTSRRHVKRD